MTLKLLKSLIIVTFTVNFVTRFPLVSLCMRLYHLVNSEPKGVGRSIHKSLQRSLALICAFPIRITIRASERDLFVSGYTRSSMRALLLHCTLYSVRPVLNNKTERERGNSSSFLRGVANVNDGIEKRMSLDVFFSFFPWQISKQGDREGESCS